MIIGVPDAKDFYETGIDHLNLAADHVFSLLSNLSHIGPHTEWDEIREFWRAAQRPLANALALVEQGAEFLIKARIAEVSPFLLLALGTREWPKGSETRDVTFSELRTLDAQDLIRTHNTVAPTRLLPEFARQFDLLRQKRNTVMHTVDPSLYVTVQEILLFALEGTHELVGSRRWITLRREYVYRTPSSTLSGGEWVETQLIEEARILLEVLTRAELLKHLGFYKNQRTYYCLQCRYADESGREQIKTAQLQPNTSTSTESYCFVCQSITAVARRNCPNPACKGNVITIEEPTCVTCLHNAPEDEDDAPM